MASVPCANCKLQLPSTDIKMCGRCLTTFYCSLVCQKAAWKRHKSSCKEPLRTICAGCRSTNMLAKKAAKCSGCGLASYCSRVCQEKDWVNHKQICSLDEGKSNETSKSVLKIFLHIFENFKEQLSFLKQMRRMARKLYVMWFTCSIPEIQSIKKKKNSKSKFEECYKASFHV